ncbi:MAG: hypothetical protein Q4P66_05930 [Actinomycetaceae bacterium]|nr:hypothetical protein [Actinomycetaceae bacterium]
MNDIVTDDNCDDHADELDKLLRQLLASSCCEHAPEELKYRLIRRFQSYSVDYDGTVHYIQSYEEHTQK